LPRKFLGKTNAGMPFNHQLPNVLNFDLADRGKKPFSTPARVYFRHKSVYQRLAGLKLRIKSKSLRSIPMV